MSGEGPGDLEALRGAVARAEKAAGGQSPPEPTVSLVAFQIGGRLHAVPLDDLDEILPLRPITRVPFTPDHVLGVLSYRGEVLPVLDLRLVFSLPAEPPRGRARILVARRDDVRVGILAEEIVEVFHCERSAVEPPVATMPDPLRSFLQGTVSRERGTVLVLALPALLAKLRPPAGGPGLS